MHLRAGAQKATISSSLWVHLKGRVNRLGLRQKFSKEEAQDATEAVEAIVKSERALGHVILSAGYNGEIKASPAAGPDCVPVEARVACLPPAEGLCLVSPAAVMPHVIAIWPVYAAQAYGSDWGFGNA